MSKQNDEELEKRAKKFAKVAPSMSVARRWAIQRKAWPEELVNKVVEYKIIGALHQQALNACTKAYRSGQCVAIFDAVPLPHDSGLMRLKGQTIDEWAAVVLRHMAQLGMFDLETMEEYLEEAT